MKKKVLYTTDQLLYPAAGGPFLRTENSIKALSKVCDLYVVSRVSKYNIGGDLAESQYKKYCGNFIYSPRVRLKKNGFKEMVKTIFNFESRMSDSEFIVHYACQHKIDIIWFGFGNISFDLIKKIHKKNPDLKLVCDTDSVWSRFIGRGYPFAQCEISKQKILRDTQKKEQEEKEWVNLCDVTTAVSKVDAEYYKDLANNENKIKLFSNVIDLDNYRYRPSPTQTLRTPNVYFAGYFGKGSPTDVAARWVIEDVLPIVENLIPEIHFYILGKGSSETLHDIQKKNVTVVGQVDSVLPYLCNVDIALVPLKFESGTRFKILEAGACSVPIVSTTLGAEGIPVEHGKDILIADDAQSFAESIISLLEDKSLSKLMAKNCKKLINSKYSINTQMVEAQEILKNL
ncbi:MAG: glycosyltransferase [Bacteroidia bacterium]